MIKVQLNYVQLLITQKSKSKKKTHITDKKIISSIFQCIYKKKAKLQ